MVSFYCLSWNSCQLLLLPVVGALWGGSSLGGFHFFKSTLSLECFSRGVQNETSVKYCNHTTGLCFFRGNFLFRQLRLACCGMTTVRKSGGHVATSRLPCRSVALQQPELHSMASLNDYKIRERMNAFWFDAVSEGNFPGTLKILECIYFFTAEMQKWQCACTNVKSKIKWRKNIIIIIIIKQVLSWTLPKEVADMIRSAICLKITSMYEQVLTWNAFPYLVPAMSVIYYY